MCMITHICMYIYTHKHIHVHLRTRMHTYTHLYIYTYREGDNESKAIRCRAGGSPLHFRSPMKRKKKVGAKIRGGPFETQQLDTQSIALGEAQASDDDDDRGFRASARQHGTQQNLLDSAARRRTAHQIPYQTLPRQNRKYPARQRSTVQIPYQTAPAPSSAPPFHHPSASHPTSSVAVLGLTLQFCRFRNRPILDEPNAPAMTSNVNLLPYTKLILTDLEMHGRPSAEEIETDPDKLRLYQETRAHAAILCDGGAAGPHFNISGFDGILFFVIIVFLQFA